MISSLLHIVFLVIQDPINQMNRTAKYKNILIEWLHNSVQQTWNIKKFFFINQEVNETN